MSDLRIVALDLSQTSTGVALWCDPYDYSTVALRNSLEGPARLIWVRDQIRRIIWHSGPTADLVILEGYNFGERHGAHHAGELGGVVRVDLWECNVPYVLVSPPELKKYATGRGNASKSDVLQQAVHRFGRTFKTDDEADARWLLEMALAHLGLPHIEMPKSNRAVLDRVAWPAIPTLEARP